MPTTCPCKDSWKQQHKFNQNTCAHELHEWMIQRGDASKFDKTKYVCCDEGRLLRAANVRNAIFAVKFTKHNTPPKLTLPGSVPFSVFLPLHDVDCYIYTASPEHVYFGTKSRCVGGNGVAADHINATGIEYYY